MWRCPNRKTNIGSNGECPFQPLALYESRPGDGAVLRARTVLPPAANKASCAPTLYQHRARIEGSFEGRSDPNTKRARYSRQGYRNENRMQKNSKGGTEQAQRQTKKRLSQCLPGPAFCYYGPRKPHHQWGAFAGLRKSGRRGRWVGVLFLFP